MNYILAVVCLMSVQACSADDRFSHGYHWGGKGFDHGGKFTRFSAAKSERSPKSIEIWVDSPEAVNVTKQMILSDGRRSVTSTRCQKAEKHIQAPWTCLFPTIEIEQLTGKGTTIVYGEKQEKILSEVTDFSALRAAVLNR